MTTPKLSTPEIELLWVTKKPEDLEIIRVLFREYQSELGVDLCFQGFEEELASLPGKYMLPKGGLLLAKLSNGDPIACAAFRPLDGAMCELKRFFIRPHYRGQGVADQLLEKILLQAKKSGYGEAKLDTLERLVAARKFYERNGFERCEPYYPNPEPDVLYFSRSIVPNAPESLWPFIDLKGMLTAMPSGKGSTETYQLALDYLLEGFELDCEYTEREVNETLRLRHTFNDPALLRRELVDRGSLSRDASGSRYKRS